jgi:anti-sigma B factor antagonist
MDLEQRIEADVLVAKLLEKRLEAGCANDFKTTMRRLIDAGHQRIALDISEVECVDSSGLGAIVAALKALEGKGDLVICGARDVVLCMFKLTRLDKILQMFPRTEDAVHALAN